MPSDNLLEKWNEVCERVASYDDVDNSQFNALNDRLQIQAMSDGFLLLTTENGFLKKWAERDFLEPIKRALNEIYQIPFSVMIEIDESQTETPQAQPTQIQQTVQTQQVQPQQYISNANLTQNHNGSTGNLSEIEDKPFTPSASPVGGINESQVTPSSEIVNSPQRSFDETNNDQTVNSSTFANFVIGESNKLAYSMAVQVSELPGRTALNPLFIYGRSGLGKTHLMRAIQNYINETQPELHTIYVDSEELISGYTNAVAEHDREKSSYKNFKTYYENADVLLIDDIQFLQGKSQTLNIVFQILNKLINQGKQIILSADRAPKNIDIEERYSSRFIQGGTVDIQPPEIETKLAIVKSYIKEYQAMEGNNRLDISEEIQMYIAENSGSNIRELKGAVTILIYHINLSENHNIGITEVKSLLENHFSGSLSKNLGVEDIQKEVENYYRIKHSDMIGTSRSHQFVYPRQIAMYLCRQLLDIPFNDIAKKFKKDHSTVIHSVGKIENILLENRDVQEEVEILKKIIKDL